MTKTDYLRRLRDNLSLYDCNVDELVANYAGIIDEMLDEGLSFDEIIGRLGSPSVLAEAIIEELQLVYKSHADTSYIATKDRTNFFLKFIIIIIAIIFFFPAFGIISGILGSVLGIMVAVVAIIYSAVIATCTIWTMIGIPFIVKITATIFILCLCTTIALCFYFIIYGCWQFTAWLFHKIHVIFTQQRKEVR